MNPQDAQDDARRQVRELEADSKAQLDNLDAMKKIEAARRDELIKKAVLKTAEDIVSDVMRANAAKINEAAATMIQDLVAEHVANLKTMVAHAVKGQFDKFVDDIRTLDARDRGAFLRSLDEIDGKRGSDS